MDKLIFLLSLSSVTTLASCSSPNLKNSFALIGVLAQEKDVQRKEARVEADQTKKAVKNIQGKVEKPTLGDLGALAEIKERLQQQEKGGTPTTPETEG